MPLQATSGAASYDGFGGGVVAEPNYIESCFSTYLYTGTGSAFSITNGIDLSTNGGLVWLKDRSNAADHVLQDTVRGNTKILNTNSTAAQDTASAGTNVTSFNSNGFSLGTNYSNINTNGQTYVSWTFRKQPKFFDVVTYTGDGTNNRTVAHNLTSTPGCIIVKRTDSTGTWYVYHRSTGLANFLVLNTTAAVAGAPAVWDGAPTSTTFTIQDATTNISGANYVAYLFAHDAGGFGLTGTDNVISCGSYTGSSNTPQQITLGYEPQWVLLKKSSTIDSWRVFDNMRGMALSTGGNAILEPNTSSAESASSNWILPNATGFVAGSSATDSATYIYIAIRRGPMKVPTSGTSVFKAITRTGTGAAVTVTGAGFAPDLVATACRDFNGFGYYDKLRGALKALRPSQTSAEATYTTTLTGFTNDGYTAGSNSDGFGEINGNTDIYINHLFKRAPSFFDEVCYTGDGTGQTIYHNLGVVPEMMIFKTRTGATRNWGVYAASIGTGKKLWLNATNAVQNDSFFVPSTPTATILNQGNADETDEGGNTYVAYLFATCAGVSKVGSYTGTGTTLQVDCGFTGGARFVLIKRTDSTGDWYVWDSARGIVSGNDPYLLLNSTAAEVTSTDYVDTYSAGFEISSTAPAAINASGGTFIFLAIA